MRGIGIVGLIAAALAASAALAAAPGAQARNVILFVGDGMGVSTVTAARILAGQQLGESGEAHRLSFDNFPATALVRVFTADQQVPDSAPTATAMVTGHLASAGAISVAPQALETLLSKPRRAVSHRHRDHDARVMRRQP